MGKTDKKCEKKNEMKLEKVKIEKQNESNGKSTRMSSKTLCLTAQKKICVCDMSLVKPKHTKLIKMHTNLYILYSFALGSCDAN